MRVLPGPADADGLVIPAGRFALVEDGESVDGVVYDTEDAASAALVARCVDLCVQCAEDMGC